VFDSNATASSTVYGTVFGANWDANWSLHPSLPGPLGTVGTRHPQSPGGYWIDYYHWQINTYSSCVSLISSASQPRITFDTFMQSVVQPVGADAAMGVNYGSNPACTSPATSPSPVGSHPSTCMGVVDPNYSTSYVAGIVTVKPAPPSSPHRLRNIRTYFETPSSFLRF
jgi:hypothetical protein